MQKSIIEQQSSRATAKKGAILSILFFCCTVALLLCCSNDAHALDIKKQDTPNGLKVLHVERHNLPAVMLTLLIKASPLNEPQDRAGTAYLTSSMLMEGTSKRTSSEINEEIEFIGASLDVRTGADYTVISLSALKKDMDKGFDLFSDILLNPSFDKNELNRKKDLIKGSLQQREEDPSFVAGKLFAKEVFGSHPYGRLVEGNAESIGRIKRDDLLDFYHRHYLPGNSILAVVGDISAEELDSLMKKYLNGWKGAAPSQDAAVRAKRPEASGSRKVIIVDRDIPQANIVLGSYGISRSSPDYYAATVMNYILGGGGFASRLMKTVRDEMGLTYSIYSSFAANKEPGQFEVQVQTKNESAGTVIEEILRQMRLIMTEPVAASELEDAKAYLTGSFPRRLETSRKIADFLAAAQFYNLGDNYIEEYPGYINSVTKDDVLRVAEKYLDAENFKLVIVGSEKEIKLPFKN